MVTTVRHTFLSPLQAATIVTAGLVVLPSLYVVQLAISADAAVWRRLWGTRVPELLSNTLSLSGSVAGATICLGVSLAWLVTRFEFPGRRIWEAALILPLAVPTYVLAYVFIHLLEPGGLLDHWSQRWLHTSFSIIEPHSFTGVTLVMTLDTYPFVYLLARGALLNFNVSYEEVAKSCGASTWTTFRRVTVPLIRPAIVAGVALVILYVVSDFGAVSLLRYQTLTYVVYQQMTGRYDHTAAAILSLLLVAFALIFLVTERWFRRRSRFYQTSGRFQTPRRHRTGPIGACLILMYLGFVLGTAFGIPAMVLLHWSIGAMAEGALDARFLGFIWNSAFLSSLAATVAVVIGFPIALLAVRRPTRVNVACLQAAYAGYVLPGPVAALAVLALFTNLAPFLYGSIVVLIAAYVIHFLPAGLQALEPAIQQVTPNLEEVARTLGLRLHHVVRRVTLPLIRHGFTAAWVLMFLHAMKELPATLLLRPVGFDTLAIRVWLEASEEYYQLAAPSALLIVLLSLPALALLAARDWRSA